MKPLYAFVTTLVLVCLQLEPCKADYLWCNCPEEKIEQALNQAIARAGWDRNGIPQDCVQKTSYVLSQLEADARRYEREAEELQALEDEIMHRNQDNFRGSQNSLDDLNRLIAKNEERDDRENRLILEGENKEIQCVKLQQLLEEELEDMNRTDSYDKMRLDDLKRKIHEVTRKNKALQQKLLLTN